MDHKNKTDQFFREKLDQVEFQPSDQAWKMVQSSIHTKATPWATYLKVAASLALLIVLGFLFYPGQDQHVLTVDEVTSPNPLEVASLELPIEPGSQSVIARIPDQKVSPEKNEVVETEIESVPQQKITIDLASIEEINISKEMIALEKPKLETTEEKPAVTITYYTARSNESLQPEDSSKVNLFDKMKFFAKNVSAVELLSDIRTAKEELIENGFKRN